MTDWLKGFSTHETTSVDVSVGVMIKVVQLLPTAQTNKYSNGFIQRYKNIFQCQQEVFSASTLHAQNQQISEWANSVTVNAASMTSS